MAKFLATKVPSSFLSVDRCSNIKKYVSVREFFVCPIFRHRKRKNNNNNNNKTNMSLKVQASKDIQSNESRCRENSSSIVHRIRVI